MNENEVRIEVNFDSHRNFLQPNLQKFHRADFFLEVNVQGEEKRGGSGRKEERREYRLLVQWSAGFR